jgi:hypothetical protein
MAILNFPSNPHVDDQYTGDNGTTYIFDGVKWVGHAAGGAAGTNSIQNGTYTVQVDPSGNLVLHNYSFPVAGGTTGQVLAWPSSGTTLVWQNSAGGNPSELINGEYTVSLNSNGSITLPTGALIELDVPGTLATSSTSGTSLLDYSPNQESLNVGDLGWAGLILDAGTTHTAKISLSVKSDDPGNPVTLDWQYDKNGVFTIPNGVTLSTENGLVAPEGGYSQLADYDLNNFMWVDSGGAYIATNYNYSANLWTFDQDGNLTLPLSSKINSGGIGTDNAVEFGTVVATDPFPPNQGVANITNSEIYMSGGSAETRIITDASSGSLVYTGVEHVYTPAFAGMVAVDPNVESQYSITVDDSGRILLGATQEGGTLTTDDYTVGIGVLSNYDYSINGLLANSGETYLGGSFGISMNTQRGQVLFGAQPEECAPGLVSHFHIMKGYNNTLDTDLFLGDDYNYVKLPGADYIGSPNNPYTPLDDTRNFGVEIATLNIESEDFTQYSWRFNTKGGLEFPDNSVQTTAWDYRNLENLDMDGGAASTVYTVNVRFAEGGAAGTRFSKTDPNYNGANAYGAEPEFTLDGGRA